MKNRTTFPVGLAVASAWILSASIALAVPAALRVDGNAVTKPVQWTVAQLREQLADKVKTITFESHGEKHTAACVPLVAVLEAAGVPVTIKMDPKADPKTKHPALRLVVLASATDGYAVAFSVAELLPDIGNRDVWIALDEDGKPLSDRDAPVKLIIPGDTTPARAIHGVDHLTVTELKTAEKK